MLQHVIIPGNRIYVCLYTYTQERIYDRIEGSIYDTGRITFYNSY